MGILGQTWKKDFLYQNDRRNKINTLRYFENQTPTHMGATYAISKIEHKFYNGIPRELDKPFDIPRIGTINWIISDFWI